jgi:hypothetical protein
MHIVARRNKIELIRPIQNAQDASHLIAIAHGRQRRFAPLRPRERQQINVMLPLH